MDRNKRLKDYETKMAAVEKVFDTAKWEYEQALTTAGKTMCQRCGTQTHLNGTGHRCAMDLLTNFEYPVDTAAPTMVEPPMVQGPLRTRAALADLLRDEDRAWRQLVIYDEREWYLKFIKETRCNISFNLWRAVKLDPLIPWKVSCDRCRLCDKYKTRYGCSVFDSTKWCVFVAPSHLIHKGRRLLGKGERWPSVGSTHESNVRQLN